MSPWKIASFNINSIRARMPILLDWLHEERPDVLCLQETKVQDKDFPEDEIRQAGYHAIYSGERSYNGVAIISLSPPQDVRSGLGTGKDPDQARLIAARIDGVSVVNTYVPQGRDPESEHFQYKLKWFDRLHAYFKKFHSPDQPLVWIGDLNVAPADIDVHDPVKLKGHVDFHPEVWKKLDKVMSFGFTDVFRKHRPGPGEYSFWDYRVRAALDRGIGWRIDHVMATRPLADVSKDAWVDVEPRKTAKPSDHAPVVAVFDLEK